MRKIKILGTGCAKCNKLEELARKTCDELGIEYEIEKVKDINDIMGYGIMFTPGLVVDEEVKSAGTLPSLEEMKAMIGGN